MALEELNPIELQIPFHVPAGPSPLQHIPIIQFEKCDPILETPAHLSYKIEIQVIGSSE